MADTSTEVSKSNPTIKAILAATVGNAWKGRRVIVREVPRDWTHDHHIDDQTKAWFLGLPSRPAGEVRAQPARTPTFGGPYVRHVTPGVGHALVMHSRFMGKDAGVEIVIPGDDQRGAIDQAALSVATDALLEGDKRAATAALAHCGYVAGLAMAIAEAHAKSLSKGQAAGDLSAASVSTSTRPGAARARKSAKQLDREIAAIVGRR